MTDKTLALDKVATGETRNLTYVLDVIDAGELKGLLKYRKGLHCGGPPALAGLGL